MFTLLEKKSEKKQAHHLADAKALANKQSIIFTFLIISCFLSGCAELNFYRFDHYGFPAMRTPYDKRYHKIEKYLKTAYTHIDYKADKRGGDHWQLPFETEHLGTGDCEDKAIWLYSKLVKEEINNIRLVVGKYKLEVTGFHAWINWYDDGHVYIIDPTMDANIWLAEQYPSGYYQPYYSYYKKDKWRHSN